LIPEHNGPLPQELLELAISFLAQSRNKASSLKPEEEIARTHACAHLACERLKQRLGLPKIQPRPPCPPKVYQKFYRYLDSTLAANPRRTARVAKPTAPATPATPARTPHDATRKPCTTTRRTPASASNKRKREAANVEDVPTWVMPAIRGLCKRLEAPAAPPHIFAGVSSILTLPPPGAQGIDGDQLERSKILSVEALIIAVYIIVRIRLLGLETDLKGYCAQRDKALTIMSELRSSEGLSTEYETTNVDNWTREMKRGRWTEMDWFENIGEGTGLEVNGAQAVTDDNSGNSDIDDDENSVLGRRRPDEYTADNSFLQPGLGTMMQDRVDYLSAEKRMDYQRWKKGILARIEQIEKTQQTQVSAG
ncbi:MAG: hypothetical protein LQ338_008347, partial [Usnochroma carphineum]